MNVGLIDFLLLMDEISMPLFMLRDHAAPWRRHRWRLQSVLSTSCRNAERVALLPILSKPCSSRSEHGFARRARGD